MRCLALSLNKDEGQRGKIKAHLGPALFRQRLQALFAIETKRSRQVRHAGAEEKLREKVGADAHELPFEVPPVYSARSSIARARDDVIVALLLCPAQEFQG